MEVVKLAHPAKVEKQADHHVMAIGFFDGIHLGHLELLKEAKKQATKHHALLSVMTFSPHPNEVIKGTNDFSYLMTMNQKIEKFEALGVDKLYIINFNRDFASLQPEQFVQNYIIDINTLHVVVGFDFTFGFKAKGNTRVLQDLAKENAFGISIIPKKTLNKEKISSTKIRNLIKEGLIGVVPDFLGTNYEIKANLFPNNYLNEFLVIPTDNVLLPGTGEYFVHITQDNISYYGSIYHDKNFREESYLVVEDGVNLSAGDCKIAYIEKYYAAQQIPI